MTDIETVATKLLGWERSEDQPLNGAFVCFENKAGKYLTADPVTFAQCFGPYHCDPKKDPDWPNPDDYNTIIRMEDALAERGLARKYAESLVANFEAFQYKDVFDSIAAPCPRATAALRIAAAAKVLREVG